MPRRARWTQRPLTSTSIFSIGSERCSAHPSTKNTGASRFIRTGELSALTKPPLVNPGGVGPERKRWLIVGDHAEPGQFEGCDGRVSPDRHRELDWVLGFERTHVRVHPPTGIDQVLETGCLGDIGRVLGAQESPTHRDPVRPHDDGDGRSAVPRSTILGP